MGKTMGGGNGGIINYYAPLEYLPLWNITLEHLCCMLYKLQSNYKAITKGMQKGAQ